MKLPWVKRRSALAASVKLVIWDLDDTFWQGTLSEGGVALNKDHAALIRHLNDVGIVNSICSKNDFNAVLEVLTEAELWDEFVFPSIDWTPKGPRIAQIIEAMQLRSVNVLFVDDNDVNRREAEYYSPGIQTAHPRELLELAKTSEMSGKPDPSRKRLAQYRVLEERVRSRAANGGSNEDFLRQSGVEIYLEENPVGSVQRLLELENRSNQLNFTKRRVTEAQLKELLSDSDARVGAVHVRDRFGDHGLVGYYALQRGMLVDYAFSCRILNMGVEQFVYEHLGRPPLETVGEVSSSLAPVQVDWVTLRSGAEWHATAPEEIVDDDRRSMLMIGGCDLKSTENYLSDAFSLATDFNFLSATGANVHRDHSELLRQAIEGITDAQRALVDRIPFLTPQAFETSIGSAAWDVVVYSPLMDFTQAVFRSRSTGLVVTWGDFNFEATNPKNWAAIVERQARVGVTLEFLEWFAGEFEFLGRTSPARLVENLRWLREHVIPPTTRLVLLNGAEVDMGEDKPIREGDRHIVHAEYNRALEGAMSQLPNSALVDVRKFVRTREDVRDNVRHYTRRGYALLAEAIKSASRDIERRVVSVESADGFAVHAGL